MKLILACALAAFGLSFYSSSASAIDVTECKKSDGKQIVLIHSSKSECVAVEQTEGNELKVSKLLSKTCDGFIAAYSSKPTGLGCQKKSM